jgi:carbon-monoxide dehydrogenase medium subunit
MSPLPWFEYHAPKTLDDALMIMNTVDSPKPVIGGTDLIPLMRDSVCCPTNVVDINNISELNYIREDEGFICIGATTTLNQLASSPYLERTFALVEAVKRIGSPQIRNRGTVTGNICNASPAADSAPPLLIYEAEVKVESVNDERIIPLQELFLGPKINSLEPNELLTEIRFQRPPESSGSSFKRIGRRKSFTLSVVSAAAYLEMDDDVCKEARVAFGSVAATPIRAPDLENLLKNNEIDEEAIAEVGLHAKDVVHPITDIRGTAEYRRDMCEVLLVRAVKAALERSRWN